MKYRDFVSILSKQMQIPKCNSEQLLEWSFRICYSGAAKHMLAGLYDYEKDSKASVQHIKDRAGKFLKQFIFFVPDVRDLMNDMTACLPEILYGIYEKAGFFYHQPNRVVPAVSKKIRGEGLIFHRGFFPSIYENMSGAGPYLFAEVEKDREQEEESVSEAFSLPSGQINFWWQRFLRTCHWYPEHLPAGTEFLAIRRKKGDPYWRGKWPITEPGLYTLAQYGFGKKQYALCRRTTKGTEQAALPGWQAQNQEYIRIAVALLYQVNTLPSVYVRKKESYVIIRSGYLLPPAEQCFLELYSWPEDPSNRSSYPWYRRMKCEVYPTYKAIVQNLGFFIEERN